MRIGTEPPQNESARIMNCKAAANGDAGLAYGSKANVPKSLAAQAAALAMQRSMRTMGGMGYAKEFDVERLWRDVRSH
jgi:acyl-CoA dehydrogenase